MTDQVTEAVQVNRDLQFYLVDHSFPGWIPRSVSYLTSPDEIVFSFNGIWWALWDQAPIRLPRQTPTGLWLGLHTAYREDTVSYLYSDAILEFDFDITEYSLQDVFDRVQSILTGLKHEHWMRIYTVAVPNLA